MCYFNNILSENLAKFPKDLKIFRKCVIGITHTLTVTPLQYLLLRKKVEQHIACISMEEEDAAAEHVVSQRVVCNTRANYRGKINNIVLFLLSTPNLVVHVDAQNNLIVPLPDAVIVKIFGWLSTNTDLPKKKGRVVVIQDGNAFDADEGEGAEDNEPLDVFAQKKVTISHLCMQGYKSALSWYYWENGKKVINAEMNEWISKFMDTRRQ